MFRSRAYRERTERERIERERERERERIEREMERLETERLETERLERERMIQHIMIQPRNTGDVSGRMQRTRELLGDSYIPTINNIRRETEDRRLRRLELLGDLQPHAPVNRRNLIHRPIQRNTIRGITLDTVNLLVPLDFHCIICDDNDIEQDIFHTICGHNFHTNCLRQWVDEHNRSCPLCRTALFGRKKTKKKSKYSKRKYSHKKH